MSLKPWYGDLSASIPVYVTRKTADGEIGTWSIGAGGALLIFILLQINLILWGVVGIVAAFSYFF